MSWESLLDYFHWHFHAFSLYYFYFLNVPLLLYTHLKLYHYFLSQLFTLSTLSVVYFKAFLIRFRSYISYSSSLESVFKFLLLTSLIFLLWTMPSEVLILIQNHLNTQLKISHWFNSCHQLCLFDPLVKENDTSFYF